MLASKLGYFILKLSYSSYPDVNQTLDSHQIKCCYSHPEHYSSVIYVITFGLRFSASIWLSFDAR